MTSDYRRSKLKEWREFKKEQGLCVSCAKKSQPNKVYCERCAIKYRITGYKRKIKLLTNYLQLVLKDETA